MREHTMRTYFAILAIIASASLLVLSPTISTAHAYGNTAQWQIGFSGTCNVPTMCGPAPGQTGTFGFWGWCQFGGSTGSTADGTTGTSGDCQVTTYARTNVGQPNNPTHIQVDITAWTIGPSQMSPTGHAFLITKATLECTGPGASLPPTPVSGCALPPGGDTGAPPVAGHYGSHPFPGFHINTQVNQLP